MDDCFGSAVYDDQGAAAKCTASDDLLAVNLVRTIAMTIASGVLMRLTYSRLNRDSP